MDEPPQQSNPYSAPQPSPAQVSGDAPSGPGGPQPRVWIWYVVYCIAMAMLYAVVLAGGLFLSVNRSQLAQDAAEETMLLIQGIALSALGAILTVLFGAAPFLPKRKWAWFYGFLAIGIGLTSPCCLPATVPLVLYWLKDDVKRFFNVSD